MASETGKRLLSIQELSKVTGVQRWRWYEMIARGQGPPVLRFGRTLRVSEVALAQWIAEQERAGREGQP